MQVLQAGQHKLIYLELQTEMVASIARQAGFETKAKDTTRSIQLDLAAPSRQGPLLLFDAADPANLGWFSRCQFYVDGRSGTVMQTPMTLANRRDRGGKAYSNSVRRRKCAAAGRPHGSDREQKLIRPPAVSGSRCRF